MYGGSNYFPLPREKNENYMLMTESSYCFFFCEERETITLQNIW